MDSTQLARVLTDGLARLDLAGRRVLVVIPDGTRSAPLTVLFRVLNETLAGRARSLDYLIALGTHRAMTRDAIAAMLGSREVANVHNHAWLDPEHLVQLGEISAAEVFALSHGRLSQAVPVTINRMAVESDVVILCGPVFPHEVAGFSGGNKYLYPGIAGREIIDFTHWLGALCTSMATIGVADTPVRRAIDAAAALLPTPVHAITFAMSGTEVRGCWVGSAREAFTAAAELSAELNIEWVDRPFLRVLSIPSPRYEDLWTAAKAMYKTEPVVADGGEVVIYAPHLGEVSYSHGAQILDIGYHVRDYFTGQWDRFADHPLAVLAHSTHVKGAGTYDPVSRTETPRIRVTLATGIPSAVCDQISLGYMDPALINSDDWEDREADGILVVPHAGERLYRLR